MRKIAIISSLLVLLFLNASLCSAQSIIGSIKGGFAYASGSLDSEVGAMITGSVENKFNKFFTLGINGKLGGVNYIDEETIWEDNALIEELELNIYNSVYSANIYTKISFITTDEFIISLVPEVGFYQMESRPVIYYTDKIMSLVSHKRYDTKSINDISFGLHLEGQYYLTDRLNVLASIGWNNYDIGLSLNQLNLEGDWNNNLPEKSDFLYFEIGVSYLLFGRAIWE
jgi:hypothetical protein